MLVHPSSVKLVHLSALGKGVKSDRHVGGGATGRARGVALEKAGPQFGQASPP